MTRYAFLPMVVCVALLFVANLSCDAAKTEPNRSPADELADIAAQAYHLEVEFLSRFASNFRHITPEAGEGLPQQLFKDVILMLTRALRLDTDNVKAHLYLGKSYRRQSYEGEGNWNIEILIKARDHFRRVLALSEKAAVSREYLEEAKSQLGAIENIMRQELDD